MMSLPILILCPPIASNPSSPSPDERTEVISMTDGRVQYSSDERVARRGQQVGQCRRTRNRSHRSTLHISEEGTAGYGQKCRQIGQLGYSKRSDFEIVSFPSYHEFEHPLPRARGEPQLSLVNKGARLLQGIELATNGAIQLRISMQRQYYSGRDERWEHDKGFVISPRRAHL